MKKIFLNYSDQAFLKQQSFSSKMAKIFGGFDRIFSFTREDIGNEFYINNKAILDKKRGGGYWLWKPYFIQKTLKKLNFGDYLFYSDSGVCFLKSVDGLIDSLENEGQDVMGFELPLIECQWTKKEVFLNLNMDFEKYKNSNQILASFILIKKTKFSVNFFDEFLLASSNQVNLTDELEKNVKQSNLFLEHRHDQSIFSLLYKKYNLIPFKDPTQIGKYPRGYSDCIDDNVEQDKLVTLSNGRMFHERTSLRGDYSEILFHYRNKPPYKSYLRYRIKKFLYKISLFKGLVR